MYQKLIPWGVLSCMYGTSFFELLGAGVDRPLPLTLSLGRFHAERVRWGIPCGREDESGEMFTEIHARQEPKR